MQLRPISITDVKETDPVKLHEIICGEVKATQRLIIQQLPDALIMTSKQFEILKKEPDLIAQNDLYLYRTPDNIMEVQIEEV